MAHDDEIEPDPKKSRQANLKDCLTQITCKSGVTKARKLGYLTALLQSYDMKQDSKEMEDIRLKEIMLW